MSFRIYTAAGRGLMSTDPLRQLRRHRTTDAARRPSLCSTVYNTRLILAYRVLSFMLVRIFLVF